MHDNVSIIIPTLDPSRVVALVQALHAAGWNDCVVVHPGVPIALFGARTIATGSVLSPAAARNRGAQDSTKPYLCFIDDDVVLNPDVLLMLVDRCMQAGIVAAGPLLADAPLDGYWRRCMHRVMAGAQFSEHPIQAPVALMSMLFMVRRAAFWSMGGFDEHYQSPAGEDTALTMRLAGLGGICIDRRVRIHHNPDPDGFWPASRRLWRYGIAWGLVVAQSNRPSQRVRRLPLVLRMGMIPALPFLALYDACTATTWNYWLGYAWLRGWWYLGWLTAPTGQRAPQC